MKKNRMVRYVAFIRAVNVGGHSVIRMDELVKRLEEVGLENVSIYRQSGNLIFSSVTSDRVSLSETISGLLDRLTGRSTGVYVITLDRMRQISEGNPFGGLAHEGDRRSATFLFGTPRDLQSLPLTLQEGITLAGVDGDMAFVLVRKDIGSAPVNDLLEKMFGMKATTRNWTTVSGLVRKADGGNSARSGSMGLPASL